MKRNVCFILVTFLLIGCNGRGHKELAASFPIVTPPAMMDDAQDRADYMAIHFWDAYTDLSRKYSADTSLAGGVGRKEVERKFADWASYLGMVDFSTAVKSVETLYAKVSGCEARDTSSNIFESINKLVQKYLYDPNSPFRNEDLYGTYAALLSQSPFIGETSKGIYAYDAGLCAKNRIGTRAADFRFRDISGRSYTLYGIKADFVLIFFSNPGCNACLEIIENMKYSKEMDYLISTGQLVVVNLYIDEDIEAWKSYMPVYPDSWYNVFDPDYVIRTDLLYNIRAIPSLYLLDKDKNVLMKDAVPENVFSFFNAYIQGL